MYVCICNALTESDLRQAIRHESADRPAAVFAACRCRAQCGTCVQAICTLLGRGEAYADRLTQAPSPTGMSMA